MSKKGKKAVREAGPRPAKRAYEAALPSRRGEPWITSQRSADAEIYGEARTLRDKSRWLVRNNPFAAKAVGSLVSNIVGEGIIPRPVTGSPSRDKKIRRAFEQWTFRCDANGMLDFYGLQTLLCREMIEGGEVLVRKRLRKPLHDADVPLELQVLEADYLDPFRNGPLTAGTYAIQGVTIDEKTLKRVSYWLYPNHPGNIFFNFPGSLTSQPVSADDVLHVYEWQRTQTRGVPWGTPAMENLGLLSDYELAEIVRKKIEASVTAFVINAENENDEAIGPAVAVDCDGARVEKFEPGLISYLRGGKDIRFNTPQSVPNYAEYKASALMTIAAGFRVPYELVSGDLSKVNFSSMRGGLVEFRRLLRTVQWHILIQMALQPIWEWWCEIAFMMGAIDQPYVPVEWSPPKFEWVDPAAETTAAVASVRSGFRSWQDVVAETGRNPDDVLEEIADWNVKVDDLGLTLDSDPRRTTAQGLQQKVETTAPGEEPELSRPNRGAPPHGRDEASAPAVHPRRRGESRELQRRRQHDRDRLDDRRSRPPVLLAGRRGVR